MNLGKRGFGKWRGARGNGRMGRMGEFGRAGGIWESGGNCAKGNLGRGGGSVRSAENSF